MQPKNTIAMLLSMAQSTDSQPQFSHVRSQSSGVPMSSVPRPYMYSHPSHIPPSSLTYPVSTGWVQLVSAGSYPAIGDGLAVNTNPGQLVPAGSHPGIGHSPIHTGRVFNHPRPQPAPPVQYTRPMNQ
ncbi:hypothetical protein Droror1_Dr00001989 [Drosera rotundifolia]